MTVRLLPEGERRARSRRLQALHAEWAAEQVAAGVDGPVPPGRRAGSDYNQHYPDMESGGPAQDQFMLRAAVFMGPPPTVPGGGEGVV